MQNRKNKIWSVALAGTLALVFASGCNNDEGKSGSTSPSKAPATSQGPATSQAPAGDTSVNTWSKIVKTAFGNDENIENLVVSGDKSSVYVVTGGGLRLTRLDAGTDGLDFASNADKTANWKQVPLVWPGVAATAGKAVLQAHANNRVVALVPTKDGAFVSIFTGAGNEHGAWHIAGSTFSSGWSTIAALNHFGGGIANGRVVKGWIAEKGGQEYPMVFGANNYDVAPLGNVTLATPVVFPGAAVLLDRNTTPFEMNAATSFGVSAEESFWVVDRFGITKIPSDKIGSAAAHQAPNIAAGPFGAGFVKANEFGNLGGPLDTPNAVHYSKTNKLLYVGFASAGKNKGGVFAFDLGTTNHQPKKADWQGTAIVDFAENADGVVYALSGTKLIATKIDTNGEVAIDADKEISKAKVDANRADKAAGKGGYDGITIPAGSLSKAEFVGKHLLLGTSNAGLYLMLNE